MFQMLISPTPSQFKKLNFRCVKGVKRCEHIVWESRRTYLDNETVCIQVSFEFVSLLCEYVCVFFFSFFLPPPSFFLI